MWPSQYKRNLFNSGSGNAITSSTSNPCTSLSQPVSTFYINNVYLEDILFPFIQQRPPSPILRTKYQQGNTHISWRTRPHSNGTWEQSEIGLRMWIPGVPHSTFIHCRHEQDWLGKDPGKSTLAGRGFHSNVGNIGLPLAQCSFVGVSRCCN